MRIMDRAVKPWTIRGDLAKYLPGNPKTDTHSEKKTCPLVHPSPLQLHKVLGQHRSFTDQHKLRIMDGGSAGKGYDIMVVVVVGGASGRAVASHPHSFEHQPETKPQVRRRNHRQGHDRQMQRPHLYRQSQHLTAHRNEGGVWLS